MNRTCDSLTIMFHWLGPETVSKGKAYDGNRGRNQPRKSRGIITDARFSANLAQMLENVLTGLKRGQQFTLFCKYATLLMNFCMYKYLQRLIIKACGGKKISQNNNSR